MRCPKCGHISFDHQTTCFNCNKDLSDAVSTTQGTTYSAVSPTFLQFTKGREEIRDEEDFGVDSEETAGAVDISDPDLDILIEEDEGGIDFSPEDLEDQGGEDLDEEFNISLDDEEEDEEREIEIDLSQFEDSSGQEPTESEPEESFGMEVPDELADISDLAPPPPPPQKEAAPSETPKDEGSSMDVFDMDLKLDDFDEGFSLTSSEKESKEDTFDELSLDDIDLSDSLESDKPAAAPAPPKKPAPAAESSGADMDSDLDFDLDLGGLTLPSKK